jgi:hypothetical protein
MYTLAVPVMSRETPLPWNSPDFYPEARVLAGNRLEFIEHRGKRILAINAAGADLPMLRAIAAVSAHIVSAQERESVRILNTLEGAEFTRESVTLLSELAAKNQPHILRTALVGVTGMRFFAFQTVAATLRRPIKLFEAREKALDWLAQG